jgi:hypothetical protein
MWFYPAMEGWFGNQIEVSKLFDGIMPDLGFLDGGFHGGSLFLKGLITRL